VSAAITVLPGIAAVVYDAQEDRFTVRFDSQQTRLEEIFAAVYMAGRQSGRDYLPQIIS
jgi:copper chaperone CopZ